MDSRNLVFSHQRQTVLALSKLFDLVEVFTLESSSEPLPSNIKVTILPWAKKSAARNLGIIIKTVYPILVFNRKSVFFTHMADVHAAIISPLTWLLRIRHVLWYAHATNSFYLVWASFFVSTIVSSTTGSCNLRVNRRKVRFINQGISPAEFPNFARRELSFKRIISYGRLDESKNIHLFPNLIQTLNSSEKLFSIHIYGQPVKRDSVDYLAKIKFSLTSQSLNYAIAFKGRISRSEIKNIAKKYDIFLNLFSGSLDKTLIEATFMGLPVVTWNREYCEQFGTWSNLPVDASMEFIIMEINCLRSMSLSQFAAENNRRLEIALTKHSFDGWIKRLVANLNENTI